VERLNQQYPNLDLQPWECLAIEDTQLGFKPRSEPGCRWLGLPILSLHMLQRQANWTVDYLCDLEIDRVQQFFPELRLSNRLEQLSVVLLTLRAKIH